MKTKTKTVPTELDYRVITPDGDVPITSIRPGDYVYNYLSGEVIEVKKIVRLTGAFYSVFYSDGRIIQCLDYELILDGTGFTNVKFLKNKIESGCNTDELPVRRYDFEKCRENLFNPALIGALYVYGDWSKDYANLPITPMRAQELYGYSYIYDVKRSRKLSPEDSYIEFVKPTEENILRPLLWKNKIKFTDLFHTDYFYEICSKEERTIPKKYMYSNVKTRNDFLSGIFDVRKHYISDSGEIVLFCNNMTVVKEIQKMLWSLGIISISSYSQKRSKVFGYDYEIVIKKRDEKVPDFIYNTDDISNIITERTKKEYEFVLNFEMIPTMIRRTPHYTSSYNLVFDKPNVPFLTGNFMPKVSL